MAAWPWKLKWWVWGEWEKLICTAFNNECFCKYIVKAACKWETLHSTYKDSAKFLHATLKLDRPNYELNIYGSNTALSFLRKLWKLGIDFFLISPATTHFSLGASVKDCWTVLKKTTTTLPTNASDILITATPSWWNTSMGSKSWNTSLLLCNF